MLRFALGLSSTVAIALLAVACGSETAPPLDENVVDRADEIVGGTPDTGNQAVAFIQGGGSACTATIIAKNGSTGYALTAAHCADATDTLWIGNNLNNPTAVHNIIPSSVQVHPSYNGDPGDGYDFCLFQFTGANASTPVIPAATPAEDNLTIGSPLEHVGYGIYNSGGNLLQSDIRRHAFGNVNELFSLFIGYNQQWAGNPGGPCNGDSGGPQLSGGRVVGVTSFGDGNCQQYGYSGRVSAVYNSFIQPFLTGQPGQQTCDECAGAVQNPGGACAGAVDGCAANQQCVDLIGCINGCGSSQCVQTCANTYPNGIAAYNAIIDCVCDVGCTTECASDCSSSSSTVATSGNGGPNAAAVSSASGTTGVGGAGVTGAGGATGATVGAGAGNNGDDDDDDDDDDKKSSSCAMTAPDEGAAIPPWTLAVAMLGVAAVARRRRRA